MNIRKITTLTPELSLFQYNEIPVLKLDHAIGSALISLQGAQLLQWQPRGQTESVLWLSNIEPFQQGKAIRGGIPISYPWFNNVAQPAHGYARLHLWKLTDYNVGPMQVNLTFSLLNKKDEVEAKVHMLFDENCTLTFTHYNLKPVQMAFHSYFNVGNIHDTEIQQLPTQCRNSLTLQIEQHPTTRKITENVDCIYSVAPISQSEIVDKQGRRIIRLQQYNASDMVLWNPWHKVTSAMTENAYQGMLCLETARIQQPLPAKQEIKVTLSVLSY